MRIAVIAAVLASLAAGPALAQGKPADKPARSTTKTTAPAKPNLLQLASDGDVAAQFELGMSYLKGAKGIKKNPTQALDWLVLAASNGHAEAAATLARGYEEGGFGRRDLAEAATWWYRAGDLGQDAARQRFLALFLDGKVPSIIGPTGVHWLEAQAEDGDSAAIRALGRVYEGGDGVIPDHTTAQRWYRVGALAGDVEAQYRLGRMLLSEPAVWRLLYKDIAREKDNTERDHFYTNRAEATAAAGSDRWVDIMRPGMLHGEYWLTRAALGGQPQAALTLGEAYLGGRDLPFDMTQAVRWLSVAALAGEPQAMKLLADLAALGQGLFAPDPVRAWVNYDLAAGAGLTDAAEARDSLAKTMNNRQLNRSRQIAADLRNTISN